ncbi:MAG TPA: DUF4347 domain-containing protein [bacterium]|mgnify:CR=1 FL=1|nr:DUF4347 domain-containing protein [bacterium]
MRKIALFSFVVSMGLCFCLLVGNVIAKNGAKTGDGSAASKLAVVLISSKIDNAENIAAAVDERAVKIVYDYREANLKLINLTIEEIVQWKGRKVDHLVIMCHGAPGNIHLGEKEIIDLNAVKMKRENWATLGKLLNTGARIDFFGSEIGWGTDGANLISAISNLTGVAVGASKNSAGNIHDANWKLEATTDLNPVNPPINFSQLMKTPIYF